MSAGVSDRGPIFVVGGGPSGLAAAWRLNVNTATTAGERAAREREAVGA